MSRISLGALTARTRLWVALAGLVATAAVVVALLPVGQPGLPVADPPPAQAQDPQEAAPVDWQPCGEGQGSFDCASYPVPLDHADPFGPQMRLLVMRLPATGPPDQRIGSLFLNPGGPGGSALEYLAAYASRFSADVRARFDIVAFNPRGVAGSSPSITCPSLQPAAPDPGDWPGYFSSALEPLAAASTACQLSIARTGSYFGTNQVIDDLDLLRAAVGDPQLSYWGISYGTRIGEVYAQRYPERIRAMILDGNVDPHSTTLTFTSERGGSFDDAFDYFLSVYPEVAPAFAQVASALGEGPMEVLDLVTGEPTQLTAGRFHTEALMGRIPTEELWPSIAAEILALSNQVLGGPLASVMLVQGTPNMNTMGRQVNCLDLPQRPSVEVMSAAADQMVLEGPLFGQYVAATLPSCDGFAIPPDPVPAVAPQASELAPVLIFGSMYDPATPYQWSSSMLSFLPGSVRATYEGVQHGVWNSVSACMNAIGDAYMVDLSLEPAGPDPHCPFVKPNAGGPADPGTGGS